MYAYWHLVDVPANIIRVNKVLLMAFAGVDFWIIVGYFLAMIAVGIYASRKVQGAEDFAERSGSRGVFMIRTETQNGQGILLQVLIPEAANIDFADFCKLSAQIVDMNTGSAINMRRVFVGQEEGLHRGQQTPVSTLCHQSLWQKVPA